MDTARSFLGGAFLAAAGLSAIIAFAAPAIAVPVAVVARAGTIIEVIGSIVAGLLAAAWNDRSTHTVK